MPTGNLPTEGKKLFEEVYNKALKGSCKGDKACAAGSAWKAVKNAGWRKDGDKWVKKSNALVDFSLRIERASYDKSTNSRRWRAVASDTDEDSRGDNMSLSLFQDFFERIKSGELVPEEYRSAFWSGGMPYLSISHYSDLNGEGVPGEIESVYIDGNRLKSKGKFNDTVLGRKCFEAITEDLYGINKGNFDKVRISIAFLDWMHQHKSNGFIFERKSIYDVCPECIRESVEETEPKGKIFLKGHLIHEALTRVPANRRTSMEVDKSMSSIRTRKDDAASIIGEDNAELLNELQAKVGKSQVLVEFSDAEDEQTEETEPTETEIPTELEADEVPEAVGEEATPEVVQSYGEPEEAEVHMPYGGATSMDAAMKAEEARKEYFRLADLWYMFQGVMSNIFSSAEIEDKSKAMAKCIDEFQNMVEAKSLAILSTIENRLTPTEPEPVVETPISASVNELLVAFSETDAREITDDEKLVIIQESYAKLGETIISSIRKPKPVVEESATQPVVDNSQLTQLTEIINALSTKVDLLTAKVNDASKVPAGPRVPEHRSLQPQPFIPQMQSESQPGKPMSISAFARKSVGLDS